MLRKIIETHVPYRITIHNTHIQVWSQNNIRNSSSTHKVIFSGGLCNRGYKANEITSFLAQFLFQWTEWRTFFPQEPQTPWVLEMAARRVQFPQAPQDAPRNGDWQNAQQQADGQNVPHGDGNAHRAGQADGQNLPAPNVQALPAQQPGPAQDAEAQGGELEVNIVLHMLLFVFKRFLYPRFASARCQGLCPKLWARFRQGFCGMKALLQICELLVIEFS